MIKQIAFLLFFCFISSAFAQENNDYFEHDADFRTTEEILALSHQEQPTPCASKLFAKALDEHRDEISENSSEAEVRVWAKTTMFDAQILKEILKCPEIRSVPQIATIHFTPIVFEFDNGRTITINYSTQPKVLKQKLMLAGKPSLPNGDPNPRLMDENDPAIYINTDPAWYAIMVVQHDSLSQFIGPDKNNTLSMKWLNDNIDNVYPHGYHCTSKSAIANDSDTINKVIREVVDIEDDSNDYYIAGDVNLEWIMYAEIVAEVALTIITAGTGEAALIGLKGLRAGKTSARLARNSAKLMRFKHVSEYAKATDKIASTSKKIERNTKNLKNAKKYEKALKDIEKAKKSGKDASSYEKKAKKILEEAKEIDPNMTPEKLKNSEELAKTIEKDTKELPELEKQLQEMLAKNKEELAKAKKSLQEATKKTDSKKIKEYEKLQTEMDKIRDSKDYDIALNKAKNPELQKRVDEIQNAIKQYEEADDFKDYAKWRNEVKDFESIDSYAETTETLKALREYRGKLGAYRQRPQTGNVITKGLKRMKGAAKTLRAANTGAKQMKKAGKIARAGMSSRSAKIGDWLFDTTLKHGARLARFERDAGLLYGAVTFLGDMYDQTSSTSKEFSNGIEFKPLCLLSADDLEGQDNVVNYGMWLMWVGNSVDQADDDAAYLQSMDFASKFFYQLDEYQDEHGAECNVDIYVVRPIIRLDESNPAETKGELFYLFMNDIPWSTAEQFGEQIENIEDWERTQQQLEKTDPDKKYKKTETEQSDQESSELYTSSEPQDFLPEDSAQE